MSHEHPEDGLRCGHCAAIVSQTCKAIAQINGDLPADLAAFRTKEVPPSGVTARSRRRETPRSSPRSRSRPRVTSGSSRVPRVGDTWQHESGAAGPIVAAGATDVVIDLRGNRLDVPVWRLHEEWSPKDWAASQ